MGGSIKSEFSAAQADRKDLGGTEETFPAPENHTMSKGQVGVMKESQQICLNLRPA